MKSPHAKSTLQGFDWITLSLCTSLVIIGWLMIYASSFSIDAKPDIFDFSQEVGKQIVFIAVSISILIITQIIDARFWIRLAYPIYVISCLMLAAVLIFGATIKGATSWFRLAGFTLQPSEFAKLGTCLALSSYLSYYKTKLTHNRDKLICIALLAAPALLILLQPDAGSALVFVSFFIVLYRAGMPALGYFIGMVAALLFILSLILGSTFVMLLLSWLLIGYFIMLINQHNIAKITALALIILLSYLAFKSHFVTEAIVASFSMMIFLTVMTVYKKKNPNYILYLGLFLVSIAFSKGTDYTFKNILKPHQQDRINVWLNPKKSDPHGALYNVLQSKIAIGSGGVKGKGFLQGTMSKLNYVPVQKTDFIFTIIGEEQGFLGGISIIIIYSILVFRLIERAEKTTSKFAQYYALGLAGILFTHFVINIGMTLGLFPVIGIPLPFISYGGSSLIAFTLMIGIYLKLITLR